MAKVLTTAQIEQMRERGTEFSSPTEKRDVTVEGLATVIQELARIADANQAMLQKRNNDLVEAINRLTAAAHNKESLGPVIASLREVLAKPQERVGYTHEIERNKRDGLITKVVSTPMGLKDGADSYS